MYLVGLKKQRYTQASETNFCHISIPHKILGFGVSQNILAQLYKNCHNSKVNILLFLY